MNYDCVALFPIVLGHPFYVPQTLPKGLCCVEKKNSWSGVSNFYRIFDRLFKGCVLLHKVTFEGRLRLPWAASKT